MRVCDGLSRLSDPNFEKVWRDDVKIFTFSNLFKIYWQVFSITKHNKTSEWSDYCRPIAYCIENS